MGLLVQREEHGSLGGCHGCQQQEQEHRRSVPETRSLQVGHDTSSLHALMQPPGSLQGMLYLLRHAHFKCLQLCDSVE